MDVGANLFIGGLSEEVDEKLLYDTFSAFGALADTPKVQSRTQQQQQPQRHRCCCCWWWWWWLLHLPLLSSNHFLFLTQNTPSRDPPLSIRRLFSSAFKAFSFSFFLTCLLLAAAPAAAAAAAVATFSGDA
jgi:hypothetical protein